MEEKVSPRNLGGLSFFRRIRLPGDGGSGVVNIQNNTKKIDEKDVVPGNIVTFLFSKGYPYHTAIIVIKDKNGNITALP